MDDLPTWVHYVSALGPAMTLLAAIVAALIAWRTYLHRRAQDRKDEWWRRTQWALDRALPDQGVALDVALKVLKHQADSALAGEEEQHMLKAVSAEILGPYAPRNGGRETGSAYHGGIATRRQEGDE
ncbi:hypothetical protein ACO0LV_12300 [Pseudactinotalea sp. Z1739]|uniref:hypothetical protein n=1 Tax=Pseudactinotalea sp. Z1739 TaxID=3413028 RepID=UPI003C79B300